VHRKRFTVRIKSNAPEFPYRKGTTLTTVNFPSLCPKCLGTGDLTKYTTKWQSRYSAGYDKWSMTSKYVTQKERVDVPICRSCLNSLVSGIRTPFKRRFAITGLILLGILLLAYVRNAPPELSIALALIFGAMPAYFLHYIIRPQGLIKWPVKLTGQEEFSFENETYAMMFVSANGPAATLQ
jgi:hypothetical protein